MNSTTTLKINPRLLDGGNSPSWLANVSGWLGAMAQRAFDPQVAAQAESAEGVKHLLALADAYAETQPSYAADLRAAALAYDPRAGRRID